MLNIWQGSDEVDAADPAPTLVMIRRIIELLSISLALCALVVSGAYSNGYAVFAPEIAYAFLISAAIGIALRAILGDSGLGSTLLLSALLYLHIDVSTNFQFWRESLPWLAMSLVICFLLRKNLTYIAGATSLVMIVSTLSIAAFESGKSDLTSENVFGSTTMPRDKASLPPPLIHIVFDEHIGADGLPNEFDKTRGARQSLVEFYENNGFQLYYKAHSRYHDSRPSLASAFNFVIGDPKELFSSESVLTKNLYFEALDDAGYSLNVYQTNYLKYCHPQQRFGARCVSYKAYDRGALSWLEIPTTTKTILFFRDLAAESVFIGAFTRKVLGWAYERFPELRDTLIEVEPSPILYGAANSLRMMDRFLRDIGHIQRGEMYFIHLMLPHYTYLFDAECRPRQNTYLNSGSILSRLGPNDEDTRKRRYELYAGQMLCAKKQLSRVVATLANNDKLSETTIVVHGDHGSRIQTKVLDEDNMPKLVNQHFVDAFSTLFAIKSTSPALQHPLQSRPLDELLRKFITTDLGIEIPTQPNDDSVYISTKPIITGTMSDKWN